MVGVAQLVEPRIVIPVVVGSRPIAHPISSIYNKEKIMSAQIIDGKQIAAQVKEDVAKRVKERIAKGLSRPGLAVILVGEDPASAVYVRNKHRGCELTGILSKSINLPADVAEEELLKNIATLNHDPEISGILVQLPLPKHINEEKIIESIDSKKDVDGFHPYNFGHLAQKNPTLRPCTPYGCITLLESTGVDLTGKDAIVIGRSNIVGIPMMLELLMKNCTVTVCHSKTKDMPAKVKAADIVIAGIGKPNFVKGDWIKDGAIVIDVGINRLPNGKLTGDVDFESAKEHAGWITPVPGGVGPMTIAKLLENTLLAAELQEKG
jgi:methylenetetrahydrofolate dehydrogenase (NADP+) / methenyltetrahydrofolate cyclohydrolase